MGGTLDTDTDSVPAPTVGGAHGKAPEVPVRNVKMCVSGTCGGQWPGTT